MTSLLAGCLRSDAQLLPPSAQPPAPTRLQLSEGPLAQLAQAYRTNQLLPVLGREAVVVAAMLSAARRHDGGAQGVPRVCRRVCALVCGGGGGGACCV